MYQGKLMNCEVGCNYRFFNTLFIYLMHLFCDNNAQRCEQNCLFFYISDKMLDQQDEASFFLMVANLELSIKTHKSL